MRNVLPAFSILLLGFAWGRHYERRVAARAAVAQLAPPPQPAIIEGV